MEQAKVKGFGARGWLLIIWTATAFLSYVIIGNYPLNIMADLYGGAGTLSTIYTVASIVGIAIQLILSGVAGKIKSWKKLGVILGVLSILCLLLLMLLQPGLPWLIVYGVGTVLSTFYGTWCLSIMIGIWYPTRKGIVMGVVTFAFPIANALIGFFAGNFFGKFGMMMETQAGDAIGALIGQGVDPGAAEGIVAGQFAQQSALTAFLPFLIVLIVGLLIGIFCITDFPEQCGAYRDNNKNLTPEIAMAMSMKEEENRRTTVWKTGHTLASPDFWLITIPMGILLMFSVGVMTQTNTIIGTYEEAYAGVGGYQGVMLIIAAFGIIGSYIFGLIDQKFGTKRAVLLSMVCMVISGLLGMVPSAGTMLAALIILAAFMGASSNYTVSAAVQYWRIEDFPSVFSCVNPVANLINSVGPMLIAILLFQMGGVSSVFMGGLIGGIISVILVILFKPSRIKAYDDKYRAAAGKPLDDALVGRK